MAETEQEQPNPFMAAADKMMEFYEADDAAMKTGGKLASEEAMKEFRSADTPPVHQEAVAEEPTSQEPDTDSPTEEGVWPSKYKSKEEADKAYFNLVNLARSAQNERDALKGELETAKALSSRDNRLSPQERSDGRNALKALEDYGLPSDVLGEAVREISQKAIIDYLTPLASAAQADQYMKLKYPDWDHKSQEVELWVNGTPEVKALVDAALAKGDFTLAKEYAFLRMQHEQGSRVEEAMKANNRVREEMVKESRKDASLISPKRSEGVDKARKPKDEGISAERFSQLKGLMNSGYEPQAWGEMLGPMLPDAPFQQ